MTDRAAWLKSLQVGDEVVMRSTLRDYTARVVKRTPTGRLTVTGDAGTWEFDAEGQQRRYGGRREMRLEPAAALEEPNGSE